ncbi:hypothetical protein MKW94_010150 [Papaver nudicaule]|uniref:RING-type E3 ubiquitin transferase n=1 Tax=Papaver nudicaule TaxID=74823 RepID=A0AA41RPI6_PAPNU|nr:hypothetical protein [Papaver nudicaule]
MERGLETREIINKKEMVEEEEEARICRICHEPGDSENPLQYPRACTGSMKFVHPKCLLHWMKQQITFECEVCSISDSVCWLGSLSEVHELVNSHLSPITFIVDWLCGLVIGNALSVIASYGIDFITEDEAHVEIVPAPGDENENPNADEIVEDTGEPQDIAGVKNDDNVEDSGEPETIAGVRNDNNVEDTGEPETIAGLRNDDNFAVGLALLTSILKFALELILRWMTMTFRFHLPVGMTCIYLVACTICCMFINFALVFVPFSLGRIFYHSLSWCWFKALSIFMPFTKLALYIENNSLNNALHDVMDFSAEVQNDGLLSSGAETLSANSTGDALSSVSKSLLEYQTSGLYDIITLATGYMVILHVWQGIPISTIASKIRYYLIYPFFLIIHLGVLPLVYGWWLDIFIYLFEIHISTNCDQRVLRKEVQYFLQYLADPVHIILRVLIDAVQVQASQILYPMAVNGVLIVFLVYLPIALAMRLAPAIFPLNISVSDPFTEIPAVMLLLQMCLPYAVELRETVQALVHQWVTAVCYVLGLSGLLCTRPDNFGGQNDVNGERQQDRLHEDLVAAQDPNNNISTSQNFGAENYASDATANA